MRYFLCKMRNDDTAAHSTPDLEQKRERHEWVSFGPCGDRELVLANTKSDDRTDPDYLGEDLGEILKTALRDDPTALALAKEQITAPWDHGKDADGNPAIYYDTIDNWLKSGRPKLLGVWSMRTVVYGKKPALNTIEIEEIVDHLAKE